MSAAIANHGSKTHTNKYFAAVFFDAEAQFPIVLAAIRDGERALDRLLQTEIEIAVGTID